MTYSILEKLGDFNPQFAREIKGKLTVRNLLLTLAISLSIQGFFFLLQIEQAASYMKGSFFGLGGLFVFALSNIGVYLLIKDLTEEEKRGTLNFIRLSPQSALEIIGGKILGVPILLYLTFVVAFPYHIYLGLISGISLLNLILFYVVLFISCAFFYSFACLYALSLSGNGLGKVWAGTGIIFLSMQFFIPLIAFAQISLLEAGLLVLNYGVGIYWFWQGIKRRFHNPNKTIWSKTQSYALSLSVSLLAVVNGFYLEDLSGVQKESQFFVILVLYLGFILIPLLCIDRTVVQNWALYRHREENRKSLFWDLVKGEYSPAPLAIAINILIVLGVFVLFSYPLNFPNHSYSTFLVGSFFTWALLVLNGIVFQWLLLLKIKQRRALALSTLPVSNFFFLVGLEELNSMGNGFSIFALSLACLGVSVFIGVLMKQRLGQLGASETKALLKSH